MIPCAFPFLLKIKHNPVISSTTSLLIEYICYIMGRRRKMSSVMRRSSWRQTRRDSNNSSRPWIWLLPGICLTLWYSTPPSLHRKVRHRQQSLHPLQHSPVCQCGDGCHQPLSTQPKTPSYGLRMLNQMQLFTWWQRCQAGLVIMFSMMCLFIIFRLLYWSSTPMLNSHVVLLSETLFIADAIVEYFMKTNDIELLLDCGWRELSGNWR